ncbi:MAG: thiamine pyrophosphate-binding protein [Chloroflexi bacterium]|nr:MAG: thiamine pyrophosphate-binding protein [Chloroflexota bacterium]
MAASPIFLIDDEPVEQHVATNGHTNGHANGHTNGGSNGAEACDIPGALFELDLDAYIADFNARIVSAYEAGQDDDLVADISVARSLIPAGTGAYRDFSYIAPEIPEFYQDNCVGCMTCVTECPDTAILGKVTEGSVLELALAQTSEEERDWLSRQWAVTNKFYSVPEKKEPGSGGKFGIFIDPTKCKGCAECVQVCADLGYNALKMIQKEEKTVPQYRQAFDFFRSLPPTPDRFINERVLVDMMLADRSLLYVGGAGSCAGCGEATALRMWLAATAFQVGKENIGIVNSTGCTTVYGSTYPYNPWGVSWTNSLFENGPTDAMGVRARWDQMGWEKKRLWVIGGDGAMLDIGFGALSRMFASGMDIKVLLLDTQVYSNTGGQASTGSFQGQGTKMSPFGKEELGKSEARKEIAQIAMMHPNVYVAQTTAAHMNHFYRAVLDANEYPGPAIISVFTTCQPEHGVGDHEAAQRARAAVDSRAFPLLVYDPRKGRTIRERLDLKGNPAVNDDWYVDPKTKKPFTFIDFARGEGRFEKHFDKDGNPSEMLLAAQQDRLNNWRLLQDLAGILQPEKSTHAAAKPAAAPAIAKEPAAPGNLSSAAAERIAAAKARAAAKANGDQSGAEKSTAAPVANLSSAAAERIAAAKARAAAKLAAAGGEAAPAPVEPAPAEEPPASPATPKLSAAAQERIAAAKARAAAKAQGKG